MKEESYLKIICFSLKVIAWGLLIFGIALSIGFSAAIAPLILISRWSGVALLFFFIATFLLVHLIVKIAQIVWEIKKKI